MLNRTLMPTMSGSAFAIVEVGLEEDDYHFAMPIHPTTCPPLFWILALFVLIPSLLPLPIFGIGTALLTCNRSIHPVHWPLPSDARRAIPPSPFGL